MIWGCLWDRTLIWLAETNQASSGVNGKSYAEIVNSNGWGNYNTSSGGTGSKQPTGNSETWKANNIYDMAGNVFDWTLEAWHTYSRVLRGGSYSNSGSSNPAFSRIDDNPSNGGGYGGCRSALYVTP